RELLREAHAARAHDAALVVEDDALADVHALGLAHLFLDEAALAAAVLHGKLLEAALARLVADGAVERMGDEKELQHSFAVVLHGGGVGAHGHALGHLRGAADLRPGDPGDLRLAVRLQERLAVGPEFRHADLDEAHAAVADDGELGVVAVVWNELADALGGLD